MYVTENEYTTKGLGNFWNGEILIETRLNKVINGVTGISVFQTGYDNNVIGDDTSGDFLSQLDITYLSIPLFLRASFANAVSLDAGFLANIPLSAELNETRNVGTVFEQNHAGDISGSLTQFHLGGYFGITLLINRYTLGFGLQSGQVKVDKKILDTWPIGNGSLFLRDIYPKFRYELVVLKLGVRLK